MSSAVSLILAESVWAASGRRWSWFSSLFGSGLGIAEGGYAKVFRDDIVSYAIDS